MTLNELWYSLTPGNAMSHEFAHRCNAVDRYLMGELSVDEAQEFEEHLFSCPICADEVTTGAAVIDNLKEVFPEYRVASSGRKSKLGWLNWLVFFRPTVLVPALASVALVGIVGYQNLVTIPSLTSPQVLSSSVIAPVARESAPIVYLDNKRRQLNLNFEVDSPSNYKSYTATFDREGRGTVLTIDSGAQQAASFVLSFLLPSKSFPPGNYVMILRPATGPQIEISRYNFTIRNGGAS